MYLAAYGLVILSYQTKFNDGCAYASGTLRIVRTRLIDAPQRSGSCRDLGTIVALKSFVADTASVALGGSITIARSGVRKLTSVAYKAFVAATGVWGGAGRIFNTSLSTDRGCAIATFEAFVADTASVALGGSITIASSGVRKLTSVAYKAFVAATSVWSGAGGIFATGLSTDRRGTIVTLKAFIACADIWSRA
jgi:hypothetical protein